MQNSKMIDRRLGRLAGCVMLLALLAVSGYAGAARTSVEAVSVPVFYQPLSIWEIADESMKDVRMRLEEERKQEIVLLDSVIASPKISEELAEQALAQKMELAARMETEAQTEAALSYMGYSQVYAICGAGSMTLIAPWQYASDDAVRVKLIAAAADQAQIPAEYVKIILPKNE